MAALGGKDRGAVNAIRTTGTLQISMGGQALSINQTVLCVFPDKIRVEQKTPMGEITSVVAGEDGFQIRGGQAASIPPEQLQERRKQMARDLRFLVRYADDPAVEAVAAGQEDVGGTKCDVVAVTYHGAESRLCVDADGKVVKQTYQGMNPLTRAPGQAEVLYSDYRSFEGLQVPHKQVIRFDGQDALTLVLESFEVNPAVEMAQFQKPAS